MDIIVDGQPYINFTNKWTNSQNTAYRSLVNISILLLVNVMETNPPSIGEGGVRTQKIVGIQIRLHIDFSVLFCLSFQLKQTPIMLNQVWWKRRLNTKNSADPDQAPHWFFCFVLSFISTETNPRHAEPRLVKEKTEHKKQGGSRSGSTLIFLFCFVFHFNWKNGVLR